MSLDAEQPPAPPRGDAGRRALAAITLAAATLALAACGRPAGTGDVISSVRSAPGSIGYVGVSYLSQVRAAAEAALGNSAASYVRSAAGTLSGMQIAEIKG